MAGSLDPDHMWFLAGFYLSCFCVQLDAAQKNKNKIGAHKTL